jgi:hypothetical protein
MVMQRSSMSRSLLHTTAQRDSVRVRSALVPKLVQSALACGTLAAACLLGDAHALAANGQNVRQDAVQISEGRAHDAASEAKANPDKKSAAAEAKAARAEKKKADRAARLAKKTSSKKGQGHDGSDSERQPKVAKNDSSKSDDAMGGSDDPLEGL